MPKGILVAATQNLEWLLPWWWHNYAAHNTLPVAFVDLGLSAQARSWCSDRGVLLTIPGLDPHPFTKELVEPRKALTWETVLGSGVWQVRPHWFKKTFAFAATPFAQTVWVDLDCEVRADLSPLFDFLPPFSQLSLTPEPSRLQEGFSSLGILPPDQVLYNSGVVVYHQKAPFLALWIREVLSHAHHHIGDQEALSHVLHVQNIHPAPLPPIWNWDRGLGPNPQAQIFHWHGQKGKALILNQMHSLESLGLSHFAKFP